MILHGKMYWAKIIGAPRDNYNKTGKEWSFDLAIDSDTVKTLKKAGASSYIKNKDDERGNFIHLKRKGIKNDGEPSKPISIVDHKNESWDGRLIGNGSTVNVSVVFNEYGDAKAKKMQISPIAVQVWDLVDYKPKSVFSVKDGGEVASDTAHGDDEGAEW